MSDCCEAAIDDITADPGAVEKPLGFATPEGPPTIDLSPKAFQCNDGGWKFRVLKGLKSFGSVVLLGTAGCCMGVGAVGAAWLDIGVTVDCWTMAAFTYNR